METHTVFRKTREMGILKGQGHYYIVCCRVQMMHIEQLMEKSTSTILFKSQCQFYNYFIHYFQLIDLIIAPEKYHWRGLVIVFDLDLDINQSSLIVGYHTHCYHQSDSQVSQMPSTISKNHLHAHPTGVIPRHAAATSQSPGRTLL
jgi:hypothetical protein